MKADAFPYRAPWWLPGGNAQTLWAALAARRHFGPAPRWQRSRWTTPDGDFVDVDQALHPSAPDAPLLVLFHGLEGSSASQYAVAFADFAAAHSNLGNAYFDQGKIDQAIASYKKGIDLGQDDQEFVPNYLFALNYSADLSAAEIGSEHRRLCSQKFDNLGSNAPPHSNTRDPGRRIRIGYVTPDFWMHPVARFMLPLLQQLQLQLLPVSFCPLPPAAVLPAVLLLLLPPVIQQLQLQLLLVS